MRDGADHQQEIRLPRVKRGSVKPKRSVSKRGPVTDMYSMPQQAVTKGYWKNAYFRAQASMSSYFEVKNESRTSESPGRPPDVGTGRARACSCRRPVLRSLLGLALREVGSWTITPTPPAPLAGSRSREHPNSHGCASTQAWQQYTTLPSRTPRSTAIGQPHFGQVRFAMLPVLDCKPLTNPLCSAHRLHDAPAADMATCQPIGRQRASTGPREVISGFAA